MTWTCKMPLLHLPHPSLHLHLPGRVERAAVSLSGGIRKTASESGSVCVNVRSCARCVGRRGSGGKTWNGSENGSGSDCGNRSKTWILIWSMEID